MASAFALALALTPAFREAARRWGLLDRPNARSSHERVVPRGGGAAILAATFLALWFGRIGWSGRPGAAGLLLGGAVLALVGLWDDRHGLSPFARLAAQLAVAAGVVGLVGGIDRLPLPAPLDLPLGPAAGAAAVLWLVGVVNFFNFLDGIDGLAALQTMVTAAGVAVVGWDPFAVLLAAVLAGATAGFLPYNWSRASIFLGDVGSYFLGYTLAALPLAAPTESRPLAVLFVAISLWLFLADAAWTLVRRASRGARWYDAHREHLYQQLARRWGHARVAVTIGLGSAVLTAAAASAWWRADVWSTWAVLGLAILAFATEWAMVRSGRTT
jgi:UDP-N-acetylmuramyl pentapeptide phosphotransferase/UDP-N-acetylglucosamine-1-phosphate transferase